MKEYEEERLACERLWKEFHKDWLSLEDVAAYDRCDPRTAKRRYNIGTHGISLTTLAHLKCELSRCK